MLIDISPADNEICTTYNKHDKLSYLRAIQPQREVPSKDRGRRFHAGALRGNESLLDSGICNSIREFDFWIMFPRSSCYQNAKVFMLGKIVLILDEGKSVRSCLISPDTQVVLRMYCYSLETNEYTPDGM